MTSVDVINEECNIHEFPLILMTDLTYFEGQLEETRVKNQMV